MSSRPELNATTSRMTPRRIAKIALPPMAGFSVEILAYVMYGRLGQMIALAALSVMCVCVLVVLQLTD